ncbi:MAG: hypothetical protein A2271_05140 [Candidatus Moranbacteria bacterium RIFOXYA12_FULL_35_19]|nr:MAG: hypothetical protein UR78_C0018G0004 [Candidatus Moranbacteria bacterium GW2011_GWF2_35_39]OGI31001.1 MAG: hypothetical protein A2343_01940 [Candidatus Moranbacteria bacterium RIFOXYB12_FULL_35_8]OGI32125.1 MAG: hypothetical protein A2489_02100 [Candidatus Moranbacteria bacterium RIFOXYC12_FULL_36_13]OGI35093.1 MAG: hypothetical protein A2271_05140 [Candidatus Moranbacteria bacterium RIFOXYA12_FULL_35_19]
MEIIIKIKERKISIRLLQNKKEVDFLDIVEEHSLSEKLLPEIDKLLRKNKLKPENIEKVQVESDLGDNFTTTRIAKSVANAWEWNLKNKK